MFLQTLGFVLAGILLIQAGTMLYSSFRRHRVSLQILHARVQEATERAGIAGLEHARARQEGDLSWIGFRKFQVARKVCEDGAQQVCSFYLAPHDGRPLPAFQPGQFLTIQFYIKAATNGQQRAVQPTVRCYSISDCAKSDCYRISVKRVAPPRDNADAPPGVVSNYLHDHVEEGDILDIKAPSGSFILETERAAPVVLIGGGVGITPVLSMLNAIAESGSIRETWFFYGVRNGAEHIMKEHLAHIARDHDNVHLHVCYSDPGPDDVEGRDYHQAERVSVDLFKRLLPSSNYQFYLCGPPPMMASILEGLEEWGVPKEDVRYEAFGAPTLKQASRRPAGAEAPTADLTVTFKQSGLVCNWDPSASSLLELAEMSGVPMEFGCRVGNCNTCLTAINEGDVTYVRDPADQPRGGTCLTCISIPDGNLVLDA